MSCSNPLCITWRAIEKWKKKLLIRKLYIVDTKFFIPMTMTDYWFRCCPRSSFVRFSSGFHKPAQIPLPPYPPLTDFTDAAELYTISKSQSFFSSLVLAFFLPVYKFSAYILNIILLLFTIEPFRLCILHTERCSIINVIVFESSTFFFISLWFYLNNSTITDLGGGGVLPNLRLF